MSPSSRTFILLLGLFLPGCSSSDSQWGSETNEDPNFVDYGIPLRAYCTGRYPGRLYVTIVDSTTNERISYGSISANRSKLDQQFDEMGNYCFSDFRPDSIFIRVVGYQRRRLVVPSDCTDSIVVSLAERYLILHD